MLARQRAPVEAGLGGFAFAGITSKSVGAGLGYGMSSGL